MTRAGAQPPVRFDDFQHGAPVLARRLLGHVLVTVDRAGRRTAGRIVETEAYVGPHDRAAHSFGHRRTRRNESMYLAPGHAYVYLIYGVHWCFNVVAAGRRGAEAVLVRALEPLEGEAIMAARRGVDAPRALCAGPGRLTAALAIDRSHDAIDLRSSEGLRLEASPRTPGRALTVRRIGVESAGPWAQRRWRYLLPGADRWWSKPPSPAERREGEARRTSPSRGDGLPKA